MADEEERTGPDLLEQMALDGECPGALILALQVERDALQREVTKQGQRATGAEHNCASARALAKQSLERWVALEAEHAQLLKVREPKSMSEAPKEGSLVWCVVPVVWSEDDRAFLDLDGDHAYMADRDTHVIGWLFPNPQESACTEKS